jgi:probable rRNA maturation factor
MSDILKESFYSNKYVIINCYYDQKWQNFLALHAENCLKMVVNARNYLSIASSTRLEINLNLINDADIKLINAEQRNIDKATNVLSFPVYMAEELHEQTITYDNVLLIGDIFIAYDYCLKQAEEEQLVSFEHHIYHMFLHGLLHLIGFDHIDVEDAKKMMTIEKKILKTFNINDPYKEYEQ